MKIRKKNIVCICEYLCTNKGTKPNKNTQNKWKYNHENVKKKEE